jgi:hypothetical protein
MTTAMQPDTSKSKPKEAKKAAAVATKTERRTRARTKIEHIKEQNGKEPVASKSSNVLRELVEKHRCISFIGITHDNLLQTFRNIVGDKPYQRWEKIYVFFPSDECLRTLTKNFSTPQESTMIDKKTCKSALSKMLSPVVNDLRFLEYDQLLHCGSYWDWDVQGGFIHISPLTWGASAKICPAMNYSWKEKDPSSEYQVYREGLKYLLSIATNFE